MHAHAHHNNTRYICKLKLLCAYRNQHGPGHNSGIRIVQTEPGKTSSASQLSAAALPCICLPCSAVLTQHSLSVAECYLEPKAFILDRQKLHKNGKAASIRTSAQAVVVLR